MGSKRLLTEYADWTDRIKAGELPPAPPRPQGKERNVVITQWDWSGQRIISTMKFRRPLESHAAIPTAWSMASMKTAPTSDGSRSSEEFVYRRSRFHRTRALLWLSPPEVLEPSPYWGNEADLHRPAPPRTA